MATCFRNAISRCPAIVFDHLQTASVILQQLPLAGPPVIRQAPASALCTPFPSCTGPSLLGRQQKEIGRRGGRLHQTEHAVPVDAAEVVDDRLTVVDHGGAEAIAELHAGKAGRRPTCAESATEKKEAGKDRAAPGKARPAQGDCQRQALGIDVIRTPAKIRQPRPVGLRHQPLRRSLESPLDASKSLKTATPTASAHGKRSIYVAIVRRDATPCTPVTKIRPALHHQPPFLKKVFPHVSRFKRRQAARQCELEGVPLVATCNLAYPLKLVRRDP